MCKFGILDEIQKSVRNLPENRPETNVIAACEEAKTCLVDTFTRNYIYELLERTKGNVSEAARLSELRRVSLQKIMCRLTIDGAEFK